MSENEDTPKRTRKPLGLKRSVDAGEVKQTFSHGRTNKVAVEVKRRRKLTKPGAAPEEAAPPPPPPPPPAPEPKPAAKKPAAKKAAPAGETPQERVARMQREAEEERLRMAEEARKRDEQQAKQEAEEQKRREEQNRKAEEEAEKQRKAEEEAAKVAAEQAEAEPAAADSPKPTPSPRKFTPVERPEIKRPEKKQERKTGKAERGGGGASESDKRRSGKLTVNRALNEDEGRRARSLAALKRAREKERRAQGGGSSQPREKQVRDVVVPEAITVQELANRMAEKGADLVKALFNMGMMVTVNQTIDQDTAELLVEEFGHNITRVSESDVDISTEEDVDPEETLKPRPPVVTIMGHVDHGKTSLLDALRGANVTKGEAGGITQHIGAYQITTKGKEKQKVTFLDTPGHEAFTQMRQRGANVTDIVVLVVAADDGIMPQTIEAINHTKAAGVPMIVAINKCDKPEANPQKVRERLLEHEVIVEAMSGDVQDVEVSAKTGAGLDDLLEKILLQAELMELKANPERFAEATVVEAQLDKGRGPVATVLVNRGTLKRGDTFVVGTESGRVRALIDDHGKQVKEAGPATPVEVLGLGGVPQAGDMLTVVENEQRAREVAQYRQEKATEKRTALAPTNFDTMFNTSDVVEFPVLVKADVQGSVEAINSALHNLSNDLIKVRVLHAGVGAITESDVSLANASKAPIIGFNVRPNAKARELVKRDNVEMKYYDVIYHLTEEIAKEMAGELGPERIEHVVGRAQIKEVFKSGKKDKAAGLLVEEGVIRKGLHARLTREDVIVSATTIASLRRFKDDVDEVRAGLECGVVLADTNDIKPGDQLEVFEVEERERTL
ncbi:translation initiation factor IF-2 [Alteraurantiacibacter aquimixticola]|uniref:Translation initiation factor IF-2 n=1 Tax=Alteraurantiacibacter aquimixticola TaxID=2489173 RepID=A0A4V4U8U8_9SPHN|nr:translation initiation factor IF-2 [Alteraurantiacibacter aquimixticola]TIX51457.1 translation initiation factor IF-2 [Alteraurantiacibacter aquimixticola]